MSKLETIILCLETATSTIVLFYFSKKKWYNIIVERLTGTSVDLNPEDSSSTLEEINEIEV